MNLEKINAHLLNLRFNYIKLWIQLRMSISKN
jgi:hypothetical protein